MAFFEKKEALENKKHWLQINDGEPFCPDFIFSAGIEYGYEETQNNKVWFVEKITTSVAYVSFEYKKVRHNGFYKKGKWQKHNEDVLFSVSEPLLVEK